MRRELLFAARGRYGRGFRSEVGNPANCVMVRKRTTVRVVQKFGGDGYWDLQTLLQAIRDKRS
jgi:hypothetical protein